MIPDNTAKEEKLAISYAKMRRKVLFHEVRRMGREMECYLDVFSEGMEDPLVAERRQFFTR